MREERGRERKRGGEGGRERKMERGSRRWERGRWEREFKEGDG